MSGAGGQALELALALWRVPSRVAQALQRPLPDDLRPLIQLAAGDAELAARCAEASGETPQVVQEAAVFYLQQVLFAPEADSYRVLGVSPDAPDEQIKQNYRWLVRWLHPDRNPDEWEGVYADRVNRAWQDLRQPARRAEYDQRRAARQAPPPRAHGGDDDWGNASPRPAAGFDADALGLAEVAPPRTGGTAWRPALAVAVLGLAAWGAWPLLREGPLAPREPAAGVAAAPGGAAAPAEAAPPPLPMLEGAGESPTIALADAAGAAREARDGAARAGADAAPAGDPPVIDTPAIDTFAIETPGADAPGVDASASAAAFVASRPERAAPGDTPARDAGTVDAPARTDLAAARAPAPPARDARASAAVAPVATASAPSPARAAASSAAPSSAAPSPAAAPRLAAASSPAPRAPSPTATPAPRAASPAPPRATPPAPATAPAPDVVTLAPRGIPAAERAPSQAEAEELLASFRAAYAAGDINALMRLFARDARNNRGGRDAIVYDYQSLFDGSQARSLALDEFEWKPGRRITSVRARFRAEVQRAGQSRVQRSRGDIRFDIGREDGQVRIKTLWHDAD